MSFFSATIEAALQGRRPRFAYLVELQFLPTPAYFWTGTGAPLVADGHTWLGLANIGIIEGIEESASGQSAQIKLTVSGAKLTSQVMALAVNAGLNGYVGRLLRIWLQFFDDDWAPLDSPYAVQAGIIDGLAVSREPGPDNTIIRSISLTAENIFYGRRIAPNGFYTDSDQQQRFPGDRGLEFIPSLQDKTVPVPW